MSLFVSIWIESPLVRTYSLGIVVFSDHQCIHCMLTHLLYICCILYSLHAYIPVVHMLYSVFIACLHTYLLSAVHMCALAVRVQHVFCKNCRSNFHQGKCSDRPPSAVAAAEPGGARLTVNTQAFRQARWNEASENYIRENAKLCPRCRANTEKNGTYWKCNSAWRG